MEPAVDGEIRRVFCSGDTDRAASMALSRFGPEVLGFLVAVLEDPDDADDVFGEVSERFWRSISDFRWDCSVRTWFYKLANNELSRFRERKGRARKRAARSSEAQRLVAQIRTDTAPYLKTSVRNEFARLRDSLPLADRSLLVLRIDRKLSWEEIATTFVPEEERTTPDVAREAARLRKRFQLIKERLKALARERGLLVDP